MMANLICKTVVSTKPILKSNMALPLWNMLQECLPDLQKELILGTIIFGISKASLLTEYQQPLNVQD